MRKKISLTLTAVALATLMLVGGTLAWFADSADATNTITTGSVEIQVVEPTYPGNGDEKVTNVTPGTVIDKDPMVENIGKNSVYIRVKLVYDSEALSRAKIEACLNFNTTEWTYNSGDDNYYYNEIVEPGKKTKPLFTKVSIPTGWGNDEMDAIMNIKIDARAIQSDNTVPKGFTGNSAIEAFTKYSGN